MVRTRIGVRSLIFNSEFKIKDLTLYFTEFKIKDLTLYFTISDSV